MAYTIPVNNEANQTFAAIIPTPRGNLTLDLTLCWNPMAEYWVLSIADSTTKQTLVTNIPMVTAGYPAANFLKAWSYLNLGEAYVIPLTDSAPPWPVVGSWGKDYVLVWITDRLVS